MTECYCDLGEGYTNAYWASRPIARKRHTCDECGRRMEPGERYERVRAIWDGDPTTVKTCLYCLAMRDMLEVRADCFCWMHHSLQDDIGEWMEEEAYKVPGVTIAIGRLAVERMEHDSRYRRDENGSWRFNWRGA